MNSLARERPALWWSLACSPSLLFIDRELLSCYTGAGAVGNAKNLPVFPNSVVGWNFSSLAIPCRSCPASALLSFSPARSSPFLRTLDQFRACSYCEILGAFSLTSLHVRTYCILASARVLRVSCCARATVADAEVTVKFRFLLMQDLICCRINKNFEEQSIDLKCDQVRIVGDVSDSRVNGPGTSPGSSLFIIYLEKVRDYVHE